MCPATVRLLKPSDSDKPLEILCHEGIISLIQVEGVSDVLRVACIPGVEPHECGGGDVEEENILGPKVWRTYTEELSRAGGQHKNLHNLFRRHVKPKKQHEIARQGHYIKSLPFEVKRPFITTTQCQGGGHQ